MEINLAKHLTSGYEMDTSPPKVDSPFTVSTSVLLTIVKSTEHHN